MTEYQTCPAFSPKAKTDPFAKQFANVNDYVAWQMSLHSFNEVGSFFENNVKSAFHNNSPQGQAEMQQNLKDVIAEGQRKNAAIAAEPATWVKVWNEFNEGADRMVGDPVKEAAKHPIQTWNKGVDWADTNVTPTNIVNFVRPHPKDSFAAAKKEWAKIWDPRSSGLEIAGGISGVIGHTILGIADWIPVASGVKKIATGLIEKAGKEAVEKEVEQATRNAAENVAKGAEEREAANAAKGVAPKPDIPASDPKVTAPAGDGKAAGVPVTPPKDAPKLEPAKVGGPPETPGRDPSKPNKTPSGDGSGGGGGKKPPAGDGDSSSGGGGGDEPPGGEGNKPPEKPPEGNKPPEKPSETPAAEKSTGPEAKPINETRPQHGNVEHDATAFNQAKTWQKDPNTVETRFNQNLVDANGKEIEGFRPDAQRVQRIRVTDDGKKVVDVVEVQSPSQSNKFMNDKIAAIKKALGSQAGDVRWVPRQTGAVRDLR